jgi:hypothetical protein
MLRAGTEFWTTYSKNRTHISTVSAILVRWHLLQQQNGVIIIGPTAAVNEWSEKRRGAAGAQKAQNCRQRLPNLGGR